MPYTKAPPCSRQVGHTGKEQQLQTLPFRVLAVPQAVLGCGGGAKVPRGPTAEIQTQR